jgi:hypothetical protein
VLDISAPEDDQPGFEFLRIDKEGHGAPPPVQTLWIFSA